MSKKNNQLQSLFPVFILGIPRSGTTLLQSLLDGHPQLLVDVADSQFFRWYKYYHRWIYTYHRWFENEEKKLELAEKIIIGHIFNETSHYYQDFLSWISINQLKQHFKQFLSQTTKKPQDFMESYFHALGLASNWLSSDTRYWVDKTLGYQSLFYRYLQWWPNARFILMTRDPRDVYSSYKSRDLQNNRRVTPISLFAHSWLNSINLRKKMIRLVCPDKYLFLRYEDLIADPETFMQKTSQFLGIDFVPSLLSPTKGFGRVLWGGNPVSGKKQHAIYHDASEKWKMILLPREISLIESLLHKQMEETGYDLSGAMRLYPSLMVKKTTYDIFYKIIDLGL